MHVPVSRFPFTVALLLGFPTAVLTQDVATECIAVDVVSKPPASFSPAWSVGHPDALFEAMLPRILNDEWVFLADSILQAYDREASALPEPARGILRSQLDAMRSEFVVAVRSGDLDRARSLGQFVTAERFTESQLASGRTVVFSRFGTELTLDENWTTEQRRAVCGRTVAMRRLLTAYGEPARHTALLALQESARRWDNLSEYGYFMYPWELAINSAMFDARSDDPPTSQWVVFHPAVGLEYIDRPALRSLKELQVLQTITIELGRLWYSADHSQYHGATFFLAIPSNAVVGAGLLLHLNRQIKVGYVFRARDALGNHQNGVLVSADFAQMLASAPKKLRDAQEALKQRIKLKQREIMQQVVPR